jgi:hypothetical protein
MTGRDERMRYCTVFVTFAMRLNSGILLTTWLCREQKKLEKERREEKQRQEDLLHYKDLMKDEKMKSNKSDNQDFRAYEDSFM